MAPKSIKGSKELGVKIKNRRLELGLTIEEAAARANVGIKTWCRYEAGESIRQDKILGICKVLNWPHSPIQETKDPKLQELDTYKKGDAWPKCLADALGDAAALSFLIGSDVLLDSLQQDLDELSSFPRGTHLGQLTNSWIKDDLPAQFLMRYDYDFLYFMKTVLLQIRASAPHVQRLLAHSVLEELIFYLTMEESRFFMEEMAPVLDTETPWDTWPFDLFDDMDIVTWLYSDFYVEEGHPYHFDRWKEKQFFTHEPAE